jgi:predicted small metal-binding protein
MAKVLSCKDTGSDCDWVGRADTEEQLLKIAGQHVKDVHKMEFTPEMIEKARSVVHDE